MQRQSAVGAGRNIHIYTPGRSARKKRGCARRTSGQGAASLSSRQPILKTLKRDDQILIANCVHARANQRRLIELFEVLPTSHLSKSDHFDPRKSKH